MATSSFADAAAVCSTALVLRSGNAAAAGALDVLRNSGNAYVAALVADATAIS
jgi:hypothetical protein